MDHVNAQAKIRVREAPLTEGRADLDTPAPVRDTQAPYGFQQALEVLSKAHKTA